ncbi:hypothetical protein HELRODRAFT_183469 [Helobdella robusta]|uniref:TERF1-interacting nuclear factor 2 N-terminal domain-containing protein n=1 Tax=Helobdella robusta TaxID=6412 RepID=T1FJQ4_HELRO|nr:hypothetical protein HELRODRAFT_183469 [Helobdella robusta]ESO11154.1 hypothetical protein HELRODRAFT_183469 [Helobdella robusta]
MNRSSVGNSIIKSESAAKIVKNWLFDYACRHDMLNVLNNIAANHRDLWSEQGCTIPIVRPTLCILRDIVTQQKYSQFPKMIEAVESIYEQCQDVLSFRVYSKLIESMKLLALLELLRTDDANVFEFFRNYFKATGYDHPKADLETKRRLTEGHRQFRKFFFSISAQPSFREDYFRERYEIDYGGQFVDRLKRQMMKYLDGNDGDGDVIIDNNNNNDINNNNDVNDDNNNNHINSNNNNIVSCILSFKSHIFKSFVYNIKYYHTKTAAAATTAAAAEITATAAATTSKKSNKNTSTTSSVVSSATSAKTVLPDDVVIFLLGLYKFMQEEKYNVANVSSGRGGSVRCGCGGSDCSGVKIYGFGCGSVLFPPDFLNRDGNRTLALKFVFDLARLTYTAASKN